MRYLTGLGLETHLSRRGSAASWDDAARAGLEDLPLSRLAPDLPYVVKSPWSYQFVQEILHDPEITLDGVIVPVRDLGETAASRTTLQLQALHQEAPWMTQMASTWEHWGTTPGGSIFSLNPIDEARLLAVGFHRLLERLVQADVPIVLLAFPRLVTDSEYLHRKLAPVLPAPVPVGRAHMSSCGDVQGRRRQGRRRIRLGERGFGRGEGDAMPNPRGLGQCIERNSRTMRSASAGAGHAS